MTNEQIEMHEDENADTGMAAGEAVHEAPSDYEFADDHGAAVTEHVDDNGPMIEGQKSTRRSLLPILAAIGGLLALGGVAWWQFGTSAAPVDVTFTPTAAPVASAASTPAPVKPLAPSGAALPTASSPAAPVLSDQSVSPSGTVSAAAMPAMSDTAPLMKPADAINAAPVMPVTSSVAAPYPSVATSASPTPQVASAPVSVKPAPGAPTASQPPVATFPPVAGGDALQTLTGRIDNLQKQMEQTTSQLNQVANMMAANAPSGGGEPANNDLQKRLEAMEQQLVALRQRHSATTSSEATERPMPVVHHSIRSSKSAAVKAHKSVKLSATPKPFAKLVAKPMETKWVLRAATPDQAWVATDATSRDLKQIKVGDTLSPIGRVTSIRQDGDDWLVQGTKGKIQ